MTWRALFISPYLEKSPVRFFLSAAAAAAVPRTGVPYPPEPPLAEVEME